MQQPPVWTPPETLKACCLRCQPRVQTPSYLSGGADERLSYYSHQSRLRCWHHRETLLRSRLLLAVSNRRYRRHLDARASLQGGHRSAHPRPVVYGDSESNE
jgi:hypothetical protein